MTHNQFLFAGGDRLARGFQAILAACLVAGITLPAVAITRTWDAGEGYGFNIWSMPANWDPDGVPGLMDIVFIGEYADDWNGVQLDIDGVQVYSLTLLDGADLYTNDHELIVNDKTVLTGGAGFELSRLVVENHGAADSFDTNTMDVLYGARVEMQGGILEVDNGPLYIDADSKLTGRGRVDLEYNDGGSGTTVLNSGTIEASGGNLLVQIAGSGNGLIRLGSDSTVATTGGNLTFHGDHSQYFRIDGAQVDIQNDNTLTVEAPTPWDMQSGTITFASDGTLAGMQMITRTDDCHINIEPAYNTATFDAGLYMERGTLDVGVGAHLRLNDHAHFMSGSTLDFHGFSFFWVNADTEINQSTFDWDGAISTTIASGAALTINSTEIDDLPNGTFDSIINVHGTLAVHTAAAWGLRGTMYLHGTSDHSAKVYGTKIVAANHFRPAGSVVAISGSSRIYAPIDFNDGAKLTVQSDARLDLQGTAAFNPGSETVVDGMLFLDAGITYAGGAVSGSGIISQVSDAIVNAPTIIDLDGAYDWDGMSGIIGNTLITSGNSLTLNVDAVERQDADPGHNGTITVDSSVLTVNTTSGAWAIGDGGSLVLEKVGTDIPTINGSEIVANYGAQIATVGSADINAPLTLHEGSEIFIFNVPDATLTLTGATSFDGGDINGPKVDEVIVQSAPLTVTGASSVSVNTYDWDQGPTTVQPGGALTIASDNIDVGNNRYDNSVAINSGNIAVNTYAAWIMDGLLNLNNTTGTIPLLAGQDFSVGDGLGTGDARVNVGGTGTSRITANVTFESDATVSIAPGTRLNLGGAVTLKGGSYSGDGILDAGADNTVDASTTIDVATIKLDAGPWTLNDDLILNVESIDNAGDGFDGTIDLFTSTLSVNLPNPTDRWVIDSSGVVNFTSPAAIGVIFAGSGVEVAGTVNVTGDAVITARTIVSGALGALNINSPGNMLALLGGDLASPNLLAGGTINGPGKLMAGWALVGYGTINAPIDFNVAAKLLAADGVLMVHGMIEDVGTIGTNNADGVLNVTTPWNTGVAEQLELNGGEVTGATITNDGTTSGFGMISTSQFNNNGTLSAAGGTLVIDLDEFHNLDGDGSGVVRAVDGDIVVVVFGHMLNPYHGTMTVGASRTITFQGGSLYLASDGVLNLNGGPTFAEYAQVDGESVYLHGEVHVDKEGRLAAPSRFGTEVNVSLPDANDVLRLFEDAYVFAGATFSGSGKLVNVSGSTLSLDDGANLGVRLVNAGRVEIGFSPGTAAVAGYYPTSLGSLEIELGGSAEGEFDQLFVTTTADLAGRLDVALIDLFEPSIGDAFEIISTVSGVSGMFDLVDLPPLAEGGWLIDLTDPDVFALRVVALFEADFDHDGDVDREDLLIWQSAFGNNAGGDADGDDDTDGNDFLVWQSQFGSELGIAACTSIPEPATLGLAAIIALGLAISLRNWPLYHLPQCISVSTVPIPPR